MMRIRPFGLRGRTKWYLGALFVGLIFYFLLWAPLPSQRIAPGKVWQVVEQVAPAHGLRPSFVYAIIMAESSLNPLATSDDDSRGLMQMSRGAWDVVTNAPFDEAWSWKHNIEMGTRYLAYCKQFLKDHRAFSYARLAASYHLGPEAVQACHWKISCLPVPEDIVYRQLYAGDAHPVDTPSS